MVKRSPSSLVTFAYVVLSVVVCYVMHVRLVSVYCMFPQLSGVPHDNNDNDNNNNNTNNNNITNDNNITNTNNTTNNNNNNNYNNDGTYCY